MAKNNFMNAMLQAELPKSLYSQDELIKKNIIVLDVLKKFIPPLNPDERSQLEQNILQFGCKDPLIIWETTNEVIQAHKQIDSEKCYVLLDGHNRFEICQKYQLDFKINVIELTTFEQAQDFMIDHQLGRRNLSSEQMAYLRGMKYLSLKQERALQEVERDNLGKFAASETPSGQIDHYGEITEKSSTEIPSGQTDHHGKKEKLSEQLAKEFNVGEKTIRRDADFAKGIERLPLEVKNEVLQGKSQLSKSDIIEIGKSKDETDATTLIEKLITKKDDFTKKPSEKNETLEKNKIVSLIKTYISSKEDCDELIKEIKKFRKELE